MARRMWLGIGGLALVLTAWLCRDRLSVAVGAAIPAAHPGAPVDVLYSWTDPQGVTHYEQDAGQGRRLQYDGSRITPLAPVDPGLSGRVREAAGDAAAPAGSGDTSAGSTMLHGLRAEMEANARQMQEARAAQRGL